MAQTEKKSAKKDETATPQPLAGTVISPGQTVSLHTANEPKAPPEPAPKAAAARPAAPAPPPTAKPPEQVAPPEAKAEPPTVVTSEAATAAPTGDETSISWTASEFMAHDKGAGWYMLLLIGAVLFAAAVYLVTKDVVSTGVVIVAALIMAIYASHQPQEQQYTVDGGGIGIGSKRYSYDSFKSFAITSEGAFSSLVFMPLKRFAIPLTIYYAPEDEERIVALLSDQLPLEEHRLDAIDNLMRRIRF